MLSKIRCRMHRLPWGASRSQCRRFEVPTTLAATRLGTSNRKHTDRKHTGSMDLPVPACEVRVVSWEVSRTSGAGTNEPLARISEMPQVQQGAPSPALGQ